MNKIELKEVLKKANRGVKDGIHVGASLVLVQVKAGTLTISAKNPIWSIRAWADIAAGEKELSCVVNSNVFSQIVDRIPGDTIFLSTSKAKKTLVIQSEKLKVAIPYFQDYTWPEAEPIKTLHSFEIEEQLLNCSHALAKKDAMNGLFSSYHIEALEEGCRVTALDGKRISLCTNGKGKLQYDIVLAGEFLKEALNLSEGKISLETDGQSVLITGKGIELYAKTRRESFPNISNILSARKSVTSITVNRQEFLDAVLVSTLLDDIIILDISERGTMLSNKPSVKGNSAIELNAVITGSNIRIGLNGAFLKDSLRAMKEEKVTLHFNHAKAPIYLEEEHQTELILPVILETGCSSRERSL